MKAILMIMIFVYAVPLYAQPLVKYQRVFADVEFERPVLLTHANSFNEYVFVVEQGGTIQTLNRMTQALEGPFFNIRKAGISDFRSGGEEGLLGLAFAPYFESSRAFYVYYTAGKPRRSVIARYEAHSDRLEADYKTGKVILEIDQDYRNHNGGMLAFGADHYLYIALGDGGSAGDPKHRAQDGQSLLGKILRVDEQGRAPIDNPFINNPLVRDEIWALGFRNPWRFSFDRQTGELWATDVGQNAWEEVNLVTRGGNYGWRWFEGNRAFKPDEQTDEATLTLPVFTYNHDEGQSVTGGYVYRGQQVPSLFGHYVFGDFVSGKVWALPVDDESYIPVRLPSMQNPSGFGEDALGEVYILSYAGKAYQLVADQ